MFRLVLFKIKYPKNYVFFVEICKFKLPSMLPFKMYCTVFASYGVVEELIFNCKNLQKRYSRKSLTVIVSEIDM